MAEKEVITANDLRALARSQPVALQYLDLAEETARSSGHRRSGSSDPPRGAETPRKRTSYQSDGAYSLRAGGWSGPRMIATVRNSHASNDVHQIESGHVVDFGPPLAILSFASGSSSVRQPVDRSLASIQACWATVRGSEWAMTPRGAFNVRT